MSNNPRDGDDQALRRILEESRREAEHQAQREEEEALQRILQETQAEAEAAAAETEDAQLAAALAQSRNEVRKGDFESPEDEETAIRRLLEQTHIDFIQAQKSQGAVADDDDDVLNAALKRSAEDWHKCTWDNPPPPENSWDQRGGIDLDPQKKGKGKRREENYYEESHYHQSLATGMRSMHIGGSGRGGSGGGTGPSGPLQSSLPPAAVPAAAPAGGSGSSASPPSATQAAPGSGPDPPASQAALNKRMADLRSKQQAEYAASLKADRVKAQKKKQAETAQKKKQNDEDAMQKQVAAEQAEATSSAAPLPNWTWPVEESKEVENNQEDKKTEDGNGEEEEPNDPEYMKKKRVAFLDRLGK